MKVQLSSDQIDWQFLWIIPIYRIMSTNMKQHPFQVYQSFLFQSLAPTPKILNTSTEEAEQIRHLLTDMVPKDSWLHKTSQCQERMKYGVWKKERATSAKATNPQTTTSKAQNTKQL